MAGANLVVGGGGLARAGVGSAENAGIFGEPMTTRLFFMFAMTALFLIPAVMF